MSDITVFGLAAGLLVLGAVLYGVSIMAKRSLDRDIHGAHED